MIYTLGLDVGSTYTKAVILNEEKKMVARDMGPTGSLLRESATKITHSTVAKAGLTMDDISYLITTGYGRHMVDFRDLQVTALTAAARGASFLFPGTKTVLDIGGQTMKASRIDDRSRVVNFRLNDKCAAGTGAFLEKTARYMGYGTDDISSLLNLSKSPVPISGVCAVFAESEVISHLSQGVAPEDIMLGSILSLTKRSAQLMKRIKAQPEFTMVGGILRWKNMSVALRDEIQGQINLPEGDMPQFVPALGCAILGHIRLAQIAKEGATV